MNTILKSLLLFVLLTAAGFAEDYFAETEKKAEAGDASAQNYLGAVYASGAGRPQDSAKAVKWYRKSAEQGDARAQTSLGSIYFHGEGVPKDDVEAVKWWRLAAEQGCAYAQNNLGNSYHNGAGVPKDLVQAHVWWNIAGANGNKNAKKNLALVEKEMTDSQKEKAMDLARELFAKLPKGN